MENEAQFLTGFFDVQKTRAWFFKRDYSHVFSKALGKNRTKIDFKGFFFKKKKNNSDKTKKESRK